MLTPAYKLTLGGKIVDTTDEPQASTVVDLKVELDMETPADRFVLAMGEVGSFRPERQDEAKIELGYADNGGFTQVMEGSVVRVQPGLERSRVVGESAAHALLRTFAEETFESKKAGQIVRQLAQRAGVEVGRVEDGLDLPAYVVDGRRSLYHHMRELADLSGFDLYVDAEGELIFEPFAGGRTVHVLEYGKHILELEALNTVPWAGRVEAFGESPGADRGDESWAWLSKDFSPSKGSAGSGDPLLLLERPVLRTAGAAQMAADAASTASERRRLRIRLRLLGRPQIKLGDAIRLRDLPRQGLDGVHQVRAVTHRLSKRGGFTTTADLRSYRIGESA